MHKKTLTIILSIVALLAVGLAGLLYYNNMASSKSSNPAPDQEGIAQRIASTCTEDSFKQYNADQDINRVLNIYACVAQSFPGFKLNTDPTDGNSDMSQGNIEILTPSGSLIDTLSKDAQGGIVFDPYTAATGVKSVFSDPNQAINKDQELFYERLGAVLVLEDISLSRK